MDPPLVPRFWSLGAVGGQKPPGTAPPTLVCVYMPGSLQFTAPFPACQEALAAAQGLSPGTGTGRSPGSQVGSRGLEQPAEGHGAGSQVAFFS